VRDSLYRLLTERPEPQRAPEKLLVEAAG
jgi:hypothetical protein